MIFSELDLVMMEIIRTPAHR